MTKPSGGPFEQRRLSYRERKAAERRAAARAAARAQAMPPPDPTTRVDVAGSTSTPAPGPAARDSAASATPSTPPTPPSAVPAPAPWRPPAPLPEPAASPSTATSTAAGVPGSSDAGPQAPDLLRRAAAPWNGRVAAVGIVAGPLATLAGFATALGWGAAVLDHPSDPEALAWGSGILVGGVFAIARSWAATGLRVRRAAGALTALLCAAFAVGVVTNPVVVDGQVFLSTSTEAREYRMMRQIHTDLLRMRELDVYLTYSPADAGAHFNEYAPALKELTTMSATYASYTSEDLPDERFVETVAAVKSASYWAAKAMDAKMALLEREDARFADNVATFRANFAQQYVAAGRSLSFLSADLNIPVDTREHE